MKTNSRWGPAPLRREAGPNDVHVWRIDATHGVLDTSPLSEKEQERAARFKFERDRTRFIVAHVALRKILASYLLATPAGLEFEEGPHGKPHLIGYRLFFNLSHAGDIVLVAVAGSSEVGVDVEVVSRDVEHEPLAKRFFSTSEVEAFQAIDEGQARIDAFFKLWTRKEAIVKAIGEGLSMPLDCFDVSLDQWSAGITTSRTDLETAEWWVEGLEPASGYAGAVAFEKGSGLTGLWNWPGA